MEATMSVCLTLDELIGEAVAFLCVLVILAALGLFDRLLILLVLTFQIVAHHGVVLEEVVLEGLVGQFLIHIGVVVVAEAAGEGTLAVQVEQVEQAGPQWLGHQLLLTAYLSHQEVQNQSQLVLQEAKLSYHGTHNDISTRYLLRW
jgi:hypothetical protein